MVGIQICSLGVVNFFTAYGKEISPNDNLIIIDMLLLFYNLMKAYGGHKSISKDMVQEDLECDKLQSFTRLQLFFAIQHNYSSISCAPLLIPWHSAPEWFQDLDLSSRTVVNIPSSYQIEEHFNIGRPRHGNRRRSSS